MLAGLHRDLTSRTIEPGQQHAFDGGRVETGQVVGQLPLPEDADHVFHHGLDMGEPDHVIDMLGDQADVERQRLVVLDAALGEPHPGGRHAVPEISLHVLHLLVNLCIPHHVGVDLGRHVAAAVDAPGCSDRGGLDLLEVIAEQVVMGALCLGLQLFVKIPDRLDEIHISLGDDALADHAQAESIPPGGVDRPVTQLPGPAAAEQQLAKVALVAGVHDGTEHLGLTDAAVGVAKGIAQLRRRDLAGGKLDTLQQLHVALHIDVTLRPVGVDCLAHRPPDVLGERAGAPRAVSG